MAPAAREHGAPAVAMSGLREMAIGGAMGTPASVAAPFVVDADGVPRLPRIVGDPPFTVKGATTVKRRNGTVVSKPALDRPEYLRQLTGQETGLNKLTVAQFLANRDAYYARKKNSKRKQPDGRDPQGDAAQEVARQEALRDKVLELRRQNRSLTQTEATSQATQWLETQTALHDPDQVAGGHAGTINGVGDARVNSAIGAAWPSRIEAIDRQVRDFAKGLTPEQKRDIYLNIHLPVIQGGFFVFAASFRPFRTIAMLTQLLARFPNYTIVERPTPALIATYRGLVPPELIEVWEQYGFGTFCDGYLKVVNPADYAGLLDDTYQLTSTPSSAPPVVLFATAMGDLLIWERGYLILVDYRRSQTETISKGLDFFFDDLADGETLSNQLYWEPYPAARERLGEPAYDECFGYVPLLALGGAEKVKQLQKVKLREHIALIAEFTGVLER